MLTSALRSGLRGGGELSAQLRASDNFNAIAGVAGRARGQDPGGAPLLQTRSCATTTAPKVPRYPVEPRRLDVQLQGPASTSSSSPPEEREAPKVDFS